MFASLIQHISHYLCQGGYVIISVCLPVVSLYNISVTRQQISITFGRESSHGISFWCESQFRFWRNVTAFGTFVLFFPPAIALNWKKNNQPTNWCMCIAICICVGMYCISNILKIISLIQLKHSRDKVCRVVWLNTQTSTSETVVWHDVNTLCHVSFLKATWASYLLPSHLIL